MSATFHLVIMNPTCTNCDSVVDNCRKCGKDLSEIGHVWCDFQRWRHYCSEQCAREDE